MAWDRVDEEKLVRSDGIIVKKMPLHGIHYARRSGIDGYIVDVALKMGVEEQQFWNSSEDCMSAVDFYFPLEAA